MLEQAKASRLHAYIVVSLLTGIRTEEARALRWSHVVAWTDNKAAWPPVTEAGFDHERFAIYVWHSVRANGDTKTEKSRRTLELPRQAADALRSTTHGKRGEAGGGQRWQDHGLVFASQVGTPLDASHIRRAFKAIARKAGLGEKWTPRELRHSFVSIMSDSGVPIETIADLCRARQYSGHRGSLRAQLKPVITRGAETMNTIFKQNQAKSA